jgi:hypothetical protein
VVEARADRRADDRVGHRLGPPDEQVVEVEDPLGLLGGGVGGEQAAQLVLAAAAPGKAVGDHLGERLPRVDDARVDRQARALLREAARAAGQAEALAQQVDQVFRVGAVVDGERFVEADPRRDGAQEARADAVEGAAPGQARLPAAALPCRAPRAGTRPTRRSISTAARREKVSSSRRDGSAPARTRTRDPRRQRQRLARSRAGDDEQRAGRRARSGADAEAGGARLGVVQRRQRSGRRSGVNDALWHA